MFALVPNDRRVLHFSNPSEDYRGVATGTADRNAARQISDWMDEVADYDPTAAALDPSIVGPTVHIQGQTSTWSFTECNCGSFPYIKWAWSGNGSTYYQFGSGSTSASISSFNTNSGSVSLRLRIRCADGREATAFRTIFIDDNVGGGPGPGGPIPIVAGPGPAVSSELVLARNILLTDDPVVVTVPPAHDRADALRVTELATGRILTKVPVDGRGTYTIPAAGSVVGAYAVGLASGTIAPQKFTRVQ